MIFVHNKVLFIRFDIRFPLAYLHDGGNKEVSHLIKAVKEAFFPVIGEIHYVWAREQVCSLHPHYHVMMLAVGSVIQNPYGILKKAEEIWMNILGAPYVGLIHFCNQKCMGLTTTGSIMIRRPSSVAIGEDLFRQEQEFNTAYDAALWRASYLAKTFSKGGTPYRMREFGCSQLPSLAPVYHVA